MKNPPAYLHIPKTGGTYLRQFETDQRPVIWPIINLRHAYIVDEKINIPNYPPTGIVEKRSINEIRNYFVFSTVRNIFDWLVSYAAHAGGWHPKYYDTNHYDFQNAQKGFDYLIKTIANRDNIWPGRKLIHFQIFCNNGDLIVDWLNRMETLDEDLIELAQFLGINYQKKEKQRMGKRDDYRSYYNDELIELVNQTWKRELRLFGYSYDGLDMSKALWKKHINNETKISAKYDWFYNKFNINGKEFR